MGTWGTSIFSDDFALDIRGEFRGKIGYGKSPADATTELIAAYEEELTNPDEACIFWLALAAAQWKMGRLQDNVKQKALEIIEIGGDSERWNENLKNYQKRKAELIKLKEQLLSEQSVPKTIAKPFIRETKMEAGDLLIYHCSDGNLSFLRVLDIKQEHCGDRYPQIEILDHFSSFIPEVKSIKKLDRKINEVDGARATFKPLNTYYIAPYIKRDNEPWNKLKLLEKATVTKKTTVDEGTISLSWWRDFDNRLKELFNKD